MIDPKHKPYILHSLKQTRREVCSKSVWAFAKTYLPEVFQLPPSIMHKEVSSLLERMINQRGTRLAIAGPCDYGLSDLTCLGYALGSICYEREPFIVIISPVSKQAEEMLDAINTELISNEKLQNDFSEATGKNKRHWQSGEVTTRNGIKLVAVSLNQRKHFYRYKGKKPSLIIFDNIDGGIEDLMQEYRNKMYSKFTNIVKKNCNHDTNVVATGAISCYDSILARIIIEKEEPGWITKRYGAVVSWPKDLELWNRWKSIYEGKSPYSCKKGCNAARKFFEDHKEAMLAGSRVLWPEYENYYGLMEYKLTEGDEVFASQRQNEPSNPGESNIDPMKRERMRQQLKALEAELARDDKLAKPKGQN
jgi:hypothetical protein